MDTLKRWITKTNLELLKAEVQCAVSVWFAPDVHIETHWILYSNTQNALKIILKYPKRTENYTRIPKTNTRNTKMILKYLKHWKLFSTQNTLNVILNNNLSVYLIAQFLQCNATGITQQLNCTWCRKAQRPTKLVSDFHVFLQLAKLYLYYYSNYICKSVLGTKGRKGQPSWSVIFMYFYN